MADIQIPDDAYDAAENASIQTGGSIEAILAAAAPLIVAAELDRLATEWDADRRDIRDEGDMRLIAAIGVARRKLLARAAELRAGNTTVQARDIHGGLNL